METSTPVIKQKGQSTAGVARNGEVRAPVAVKVIGGQQSGSQSNRKVCLSAKTTRASAKPYRKSRVVADREIVIPVVVKVAGQNY